LARPPARATPRAGTSPGVCRPGCSSSWQAIAPYTFEIDEVGFGDFNGDGKTDVFRATGARWYYSPSGTGAFVPLNVSGARISSLRLGDFDGDGKADVFGGRGLWGWSGQIARSKWLINWQRSEWVESKIWVPVRVTPIGESMNITKASSRPPYHGLPPAAGCASRGRSGRRSHRESRRESRRRQVGQR